MTPLEQLNDQEAKLLKELETLRKKQNIHPLLNSALADWKAKLQAKANRESGKYRLVVFASNPMETRWHREQSPYVPPIFSDYPWTAELWYSEGRYDGSFVESALADDPYDLLPPLQSFLLLSLFKLPYLICPTTVEKLPILDKNLYLPPETSPWSFGVQSLLRFDSPVMQTDIHYPKRTYDLTDAESLRKFYLATRHEYEYGQSLESKVWQEKRNLKKARRRAKTYDSGLALHNLIMDPGVDF